MVRKSVDVDVDLEDFDEDDLIDELQCRGYDFLENTSDQELIEECQKRDLFHPTYGDSESLIDKIFHLRRQGKPFDQELDEYLYIKTGRAL